MQVAEIAAKEGYSGMEWSCLDWNKPSIEFYNKLGAATESGRVIKLPWTLSATHAALWVILQILHLNAL